MTAEPFNVLFFGQFIPLHGIEYILKAARLLNNNNDIQFTIIGKGQEYDRMKQLDQSLGLTNTEWLGWVRHEDVRKHIQAASVCLGIFGNTDKARRVIPNKAYEILACRKPLITGDSPAAREALVDRQHCLLVRMADPRALAQAILELKHSDRLRESLAENGYRLYLERFTAEAIGRLLLKDLMDAATADGTAWTQSPRFIMRKLALKEMIKGLPPGRFLEVGFGSGYIMRWLAAKGFTGVGLEHSTAAARIAQRLIADHSSRLKIIFDENELRGRQFDYLMAFDVLEHIRDDSGALAKWRGWLKDDGFLVMSVPAHMRHWGASDLYVGHYRRYEKDQLRKLLAKCGFEVMLLWSYGFPICNLIRPIRNWHYQRELDWSRMSMSLEERSKDSGFKRTWEAKLRLFMKDAFFYPFHAIQMRFVSRDLGDGYIVLAKKKQSNQ